MTGQPAAQVALNADVVNYSRLLADDRDATTARMEEYRHHVEGSVHDSGGTLVTFVGDNFMAVFDEVIDALRCAISISTEIEKRNEGTAISRQVRFRMGIDVGDVVSVDGQYFGDALNIAARIQAIARPGGLSVSGAVYRALDEPALRFRALGLQDLKNIPEEVDVYEFVDLPTAPSTNVDRGEVSLAAPTLAILPVHGESLDASGKGVAEAFRGEVLHRLSRIPQLQVIDARVRGGNGLAGAARYMIETGMSQVGSRIRVYATLVDVNTMNIVKSHRWSGVEGEVFEAMESLAEEVATSVEVELIIGEPAGLYAEIADPAAIENVYLGWYHLTSGTPDGWARSLELFGEVAEQHPDQPFGHVLTAFAMWMGANYGWARRPDEAMETALASARKGFETGDPTGLARMVEAAVLMSQGRGREALEAVEGAEIMRPTCDVTYGLEGSVRRYLGQWDHSVDLEDRAMRLTGVSNPWYPTVKGCSLFLGGRVEQAAAIVEQVLEHQPNNLEALLVLAAAQVEMGLDRRARATADMIRRRFPAVDISLWLDTRPFEDREQVERWRTSLAEAGVLAPA